MISIWQAAYGKKIQMLSNDFSIDMKIALVHDYLNEFGGAERVLKVLSEMYPEAPIYTAFRVKGSSADKNFKDKKIKESFLAPVLKTGKLYSPLRFLAPIVWKSFDFSDYDVVLTSSSWYITRGFRIGKNTKIICYCHTPPRWLYGYETSIELQKYWPVRVYAAIVGHFMRLFDFQSAQQVDLFIANSKNVQKRIEKFYRRDSLVIYPPVDLKKIKKQAAKDKRKIKEKYFLIVSRLVGAKGLEEAAKAFEKIKGYKLKIVGEKHGFSQVEKKLQKLSGDNVELLGRLDDAALYRTYARAVGFIALARQEDFGMTVVEAMAAGTPVIAFNGGGFRESVVDGKTGVLIDDTKEQTLREAVEKIVNSKWDKRKLRRQAQKFSRARFEKEIKKVVQEKKKI